MAKKKKTQTIRQSNKKGMKKSAVEGAGSTKGDLKGVGRGGRANKTKQVQGATGGKRTSKGTKMKGAGAAAKKKPRRHERNYEPETDTSPDSKRKKPKAETNLEIQPRGTPGKNKPDVAIAKQRAKRRGKATTEG